MVQHPMKKKFDSRVISLYMKRIKFYWVKNFKELQFSTNISFSSPTVLISNIIGYFGEMSMQLAFFIRIALLIPAFFLALI